MMDLDFTLFAKAVEPDSLSAAGRALAISPAMMSEIGFKSEFFNSRARLNVAIL